MSLPLVRERNLTRDERENSVVLADGDPFARKDISTALTHEDRTRLCSGSWGDLEAEILWIRISTILTNTG